MEPLNPGQPFHRRLTLTPVQASSGVEGPVGRLVKHYEASRAERNRPWIIRADLDPKTFNQVVVSITNRRRDRLHLVLKRDGKRVFGTPAILLSGNPEPQIIIFDVPALRRQEETITELEVLLQSGGEGYRFHALDLVYLPLHAILPTGEGDLVNAEGEARRVIGLVSDRPLEATIPLPKTTAGCRLTFSVLQPQELRYARQKPHIVVTATDAGGRSVNKTIKLEERVSPPAVWVPVELDLTPLSGGEVTVRIKLQVKGDVPGACVLEPPLLSSPSTSGRTVLLITSDTHRADALGVVRTDHPVHTPHLDALAARGVHFTDCYSSTNVTSPSHVAIMTGTSPRDTGIVSNTGHLAEEALTLAEQYRKRGYITYAVTSVRHLGPLGTGLGQGFDRIAAPAGEVWDAEVTLDRLESWLPDARGFPLFVWLHLFDAHAPYSPPGEFDRRYYPKDRDPFDPALPEPQGPDARWLGEHLRGLRDVKFARAQYRGEVDYLDHQLGRILERPRFRNGMVAFTADHGESFGSGGVWFSHTGLYPANLHVPLILSWPGGPSGAEVDHPVEHIDLGRTLLDLSGFEDDAFPGRSLLPAIEGRALVEPRFTLSANGNSASVSVDGWQLILNLRNHTHHLLVPRQEHQVELFHIAVDPGCQRDLLKDEPARAGALRRMVIAWLRDTRGTSWARTGSEDNAALAQLAALGYAMEAPSDLGRVWFEDGCDCDCCSRFAE
jgi:arylsulfatase A-like enzyme